MYCTFALYCNYATERRRFRRMWHTTFLLTYLWKRGYTGLSTDDLLCFYKSVILFVLEYGLVVWHHHLTHTQSDKLEALQKRAVRI